MEESSKTENRFEIVKFTDGNFELEVNVSPNEETVWLKTEDMADLFSVDRTSIQKHIHNIIKSEELDKSTCAFFAQVKTERGRFYSPTNQRFLKAGKGVEHDLIELDETDLHGPFNSVEELMEDLNADY